MGFVHPAFQVGLRFELFFALQLLTNSESRLHPEWRASALGRLPKAFLKRLRAIGLSSAAWPVIATIDPNTPVDCSFEVLRGALGRTPHEEFALKLLDGLLHDNVVSGNCVQGRCTLKQAVAAAKPKKREWLMNIGLYPYDRGNPLVQSLENLISDPSAWKKELLGLLQEFWELFFRAEWNRLVPALTEAANQKKRLQSVLTLEEFFDRSLIKATVTEDGFQALRGGYAVSFDKIEACTFIPSVFNETRLWSALDTENGKVNVFFPFYEPSIALTPEVTHRKNKMAARVKAVSDVDPFLVVKALGDATRFQIVNLLALNPRSSSELADALSLTRATISHHISLLSQAGLLLREEVNGSIHLFPNPERLSEISGALLERFGFLKGDRSANSKEKK